MSLFLLTKFFLAAWLLNVVWEFAHCQLYETCRRQSWRQNTPLLLKMSIKDGLLIVLFYLVATWILPGRSSTDAGVLAIFTLLAIIFSLVDEKISVKLKRWEYAAAMPTIAGVGLTPLLEISLTGLAAVAIIFY